MNLDKFDGDVLQSMTSEHLPMWKLIRIGCKMQNKGRPSSSGQWLVIDQNIGGDLLPRLFISLPFEDFCASGGVPYLCLEKQNVKLFVTFVQSPDARKPSSNCVSRTTVTYWQMIVSNVSIVRLFDCRAICSTELGETNCHPGGGICSLIQTIHQLGHTSDNFLPDMLCGIAWGGAWWCFQKCLFETLTASSGAINRDDSPLAATGHI